MAVLEPGGVEPGELSFAGGGFGDENAEREIEGEAGRRQHEGCAGFGAAEDEDLGGWHGEAGGGGFAGVIDEAEELDAFFFEERFEAGDGFVDGVFADAGLNAFGHGGGPHDQRGMRVEISYIVKACGNSCVGFCFLWLGLERREKTSSGKTFKGDGDGTQ